MKELAEFLSSINLSARPDGTWPFELKTMPRVTGRSTRVIITEYDLPRREAQPHDAGSAQNRHACSIGHRRNGNIAEVVGEQPLRTDGCPGIPEEVFPLLIPSGTDIGSVKFYNGGDKVASFSWKGRFDDWRDSTLVPGETVEVNLKGTPG